MRELQAASLSKGEELSVTTSLLAEERAGHKEQLKRVSVELADVRGQLEMQVRRGPVQVKGAHVELADVWGCIRGVIQARFSGKVRYIRWGGSIAAVRAAGAAGGRHSFQGHDPVG